MEPEMNRNSNYCAYRRIIRSGPPLRGHCVAADFDGMDGNVIFY